jgi:hypothetical protein
MMQIDLLAFAFLASSRHDVCHLRLRHFHDRSAGRYRATAAQRAVLPPKTKTAVPFVVAAFLASWFAIAIIVGDGSTFPIPLESRQPISGLVALIPFSIVVIALFASKTMRRAGRICLAGGNWGCTNWNLRADRSIDGGAKPTECSQLGGGVESFRHARSYRCSRHGALLPGARP